MREQRALRRAGGARGVHEQHRVVGADRLDRVARRGRGEAALVGARALPPHAMRAAGGAGRARHAASMRAASPSSWTSTRGVAVVEQRVQLGRGEPRIERQSRSRRGAPPRRPSRDRRVRLPSTSATRSPRATPVRGQQRRAARACGRRAPGNRAGDPRRPGRAASPRRVAARGRAGSRCCAGRNACAGDGTRAETTGGAREPERRAGVRRPPLRLERVRGHAGSRGLLRRRARGPQPAAGRAWRRRCCTTPSATSTLRRVVSEEPVREPPRAAGLGAVRADSARREAAHALDDHRALQQARARLRRERDGLHARERRAARSCAAARTSRSCPRASARPRPASWWTRRARSRRSRGRPSRPPRARSSRRSRRRSMRGAAGCSRGPARTTTRIAKRRASSASRTSSCRE